MAGKNDETHRHDTTSGVQHTQDLACSTLALTIIKDALDDIERNGDRDARRWMRNPDGDYPLPLRAACNAAGQSVEAVQDEARSRLKMHLEPDDPLKHDHVDDLQVLRDHEITWISKREATERFEGVTMSMIGYRLENGIFESVLAPKDEDTSMPVRYVPLSKVRALFG